MKIYTKTGDEGETSLVSGSRVLKSDERINLYGSIDELNSWLGLLLSHLQNKDFAHSSIEVLTHVQHNLFNFGSLVACESDKREQFKLPKINSSLILKIESEIDTLESSLDTLKNFILPGGGQAASVAHIARTKARDVERRFIGFIKNSKAEDLENGKELLNRLSDYLFVLARYINKNMKCEETKWDSKK